MMHGPDGRITAMAKRPRHPLRWIGIGLMVAAVVQELSRPADERTWHGQLVGIVPYDLRPPTLQRVRDAWWNPDDPRLLTDRPFGVGWSVNLARVVAAVRDASTRPAG